MGQLRPLSHSLHTAGFRVARTRARHCASCRLWGGGAARELATRARRATLIVVDPYTIKGHCTGEKPLSFGARSWCDVPPPTPTNSRVFLRAKKCAGAPLRSLSLGGRRRSTTRACDARAPCRACCGRSIPYTKAPHRREAERPLSFIATRPWCSRLSLGQRAGAPLRARALSSWRSTSRMALRRYGRCERREDHDARRSSACGVRCMFSWWWCAA